MILQTHLSLPFNDARTVYVNSSYHDAAAQTVTVQQQYIAELREDLEIIMRLVEVRLCKTLSLFKFYIMGCR
jgi:hypothetical protein